jgi:hypothetical protein
MRKTELWIAYSNYFSNDIVLAHEWKLESSYTNVDFSCELPANSRQKVPVTVLNYFNWQSLTGHHADNSCDFVATCKIVRV